MTDRLKTYSGIAAVLLVASGGFIVRAQAPSDAASLRDQLRERYDVVALKDGLGIVPHQRDAGIPLIEILDGVVSINGEAVTAKEARTRLGKDADLILRVTYLDAAGQRELTGAGQGASTPSPLPLAPPSPPEPPRATVSTGDKVRIGGSVKVERDEWVDGDVVAVGGSGEVDGYVTGEVTIVGGSLNLGPEAVVDGDITVIGGTLNRSPGARIEGKADILDFGPRGKGGDWDIKGAPFWSAFWRAGNLVGTVLRITLLMLGALVVVALGARYVELIADRTATEPLRAGVAGLLAEVRFVPLLVITVIVLAISIIGIPLLLLIPFAMVFALVLLLVGFTGVASHVGRMLSTRFGLARGPNASVALGVAAIVALTLVARMVALAGGFAFGGFVGGLLAAVGYLVEYVAWTVGVGAVILTWLSTRRRASRPEVPVAPAMPRNEVPAE